MSKDAKTTAANFDVLSSWLTSMKEASSEEQGHKTAPADPEAPAKDAGVKESQSIPKAQSPGTHVDNVPAAGGAAAVTPKLSDKTPTIVVGDKAPNIKKTTNAKGECSKCGSKDCLGGCEDLAKQAEMERTTHLGNTILAILKEASAPEAPEGMQKSAELTAMEKEAEEFGKEASDLFMLGRLQRMKDEADVEAAGIAPELLQKLGGVSGLLDKVAEADPTAPVPPEILAADGIQPGAGAMDPAALAGAMGAEGAPGDDDSAVMDQISQVLQENNISPEELDQMIQQIAAAREAGASDEEIMQALIELADEAGGEGAAPADVAGEGAASAGAEGGTPPAEPPAPAPKEEKAPEKEAALNKEAAERVTAVKDFFRQAVK